MPQLSHQLIDVLLQSSYFEEASAAVLRTMLTLAEEALAKSAFAPRARLLRGMIYLHPGDGYQRLFGIEHGSGARVDGIGYLASANVWRWITEHCSSVSIDVRLEAIRPHLSGGAVRVDLERGNGLPGRETRERMLNRDATHVHVVPLQAPGGAVAGMISIEASCKAAMGQDFIWEDCDERFRLCASIAAPYLLALPPQEVPPAETDELLPVVGASMANLIGILRAFARQEETLLITGPTGSGKSRLARWCHERSERRGQPFEVLELTSVPEDLQLAELFGWKRGAFTGAIKDTLGAIARAQKGTLFLDEIDKLSLKAQAGLLRVIEERRYRPLGDEAGERHADVRFIVGTNADLRALVRQGSFREDLYYRINVLPVRLPPLSERLDELPLWAEYMLKRHHSKNSTGAARFTKDAVRLLLDTPWPGNLRQLDNIVRRAYTIAVHEQNSVGGALIVDRRHVESALAYEEEPASSSLLAQLWRVAGAFVQEAERRAQAGRPLSLDLCEAFRGLVLGAALHRLGDRERTFELFGQQQMIKHRNHHKALRREIERLHGLAGALGGEGDRQLMELFEELKRSTETR